MKRGRDMKVINVVSAIFVVGFYFTLLYTIPRAITTVNGQDIKMAMLNVFLLIWFGFLFKGTAKGGCEDDG
jgi:hypothetical protein